MPEPMLRILLDGVASLSWFALLVARLGVGLMFAFSGWHKLRDPKRHAKMVETLGRASIPCPWLTAPFVAAVELLAGSLLTVGLLTAPAALALLVITIVAIATVSLEEVNSGGGTWLENFLYLPETLYVITLMLLITIGPGAASVDRLLRSLLA